MSTHFVTEEKPTRLLLDPDELLPLVFLDINRINKPSTERAAPDDATYCL